MAQHSGVAVAGMGVVDLVGSGEVWKPLPNVNYYIFIFHQILYNRSISAVSNYYF